MKKTVEEGIFELITGPMFSGKTVSLIKRYKEAQSQSKTVACFKPAIDQRYDDKKITTHTGDKIEAKVINQPQEILAQNLNPNTIVIIDEVQFFDGSIVEVIEKLMQANFHVVASGLEYDYMGNTFGEMEKLKKLCTTLTRLTGKCDVCSSVGTHTFRKNKDITDTVLIGSHDLYEIRCETCYNKAQ